MHTADNQSNVVTVDLNITAETNNIVFKGNLPTNATEDSPYEYQPQITDKDLPEYTVDITESTNNGESSLTIQIRDEDLTTVETIAIDSSTTQVNVTKNITYHFIYHGTESFNLYKGNDSIHEFNSENPDFRLTLHNHDSLGTNLYHVSDGTQSVNLNITANNLYTYSLIGKPAWLTLNTATGALTGTPTQANVNTYTDLQYTVQKTASNRTSTDAFDITVINTNDRPIANAVSRTQVDEGNSINITLSGEDDDGDSLSFQLLSPPNNLDGRTNIVGNTLTYTHNGDENTGLVQLQYQASDGELISDPATIEINVNSVNDAPVFNDMHVLVNLNDNKNITLTATDADSANLTYAIVQNTTLNNASASLQNNILTYNAPSTLPGESYTDQIIVSASDNAETTSATINIYFYHQNEHPQQPLNIPNIQTRMGTNTSAGTILWDLNNQHGFRDVVTNAAIRYTKLSNDKFIVEESTGYLKVADNAEFNSNQNETIEVSAVAQLNNLSFIAVTFTVTVDIIPSLNLDDGSNNGIPDQIDSINTGELILDNDFNFNESFADFRKENVTIEVDSGNDVTINNAKLKLKKMIIGGREKSTLKMNNEGTLDIATDMILGSEIGDKAEMTLNHKDAIFKLGDDFIIGEEGTATFNISNGEAQINGALTLEKQPIRRRHAH